MTLTDTHCHLDFEQFDADRGEVLERARDAGLVRMLVPGLDLESSRRAVRLAEIHPMIFAAVGFHPTELDRVTETAFEELQRLAGHSKVVAIGEIGIDYYWVKDQGRRAAQREILEQQLEFARQVDKPAIIHMREEGDAWHGPASSDLLEILARWHAHLFVGDGRLSKFPGVLHSFNGNMDTAQQALDLGFFIGVTGPVTYRNAQRKRELIQSLPLEKILIETDAPFLPPHPHRGRRNEPAFVCHIADKIGELHSISPEEAAAVTTRNAARLFAWGD